MANGFDKRAGIVIGALRGGSGKTMVSLGLIAAMTAKGRSVAPFKKGPDYIDAGWLSLAAGGVCYNLDTFLIASDRIRETFHVHTADTDMAVIEGNRGIYDCIDTHGETSTAELAKLLGLPILLIIDGTKNHPHHGGRGQRLFTIRSLGSHRWGGAEPDSRRPARRHITAEH